MAKAYLSLGSNEQPEHYLQLAVEALRSTFGDIVLSDWVQTKAVRTYQRLSAPYIATLSQGPSHAPT